MKLKKSILFWSLLVMAVFLAVSQILSHCGLMLRVWIREPLSYFTGVGAAIGILQLLLHIPKKWLKVLTVVLWAAAAAFGLWYSWLLYGFCHFEEWTEERNGVKCVCEFEHVLWTSHSYYYEAHGPFLRGTELLDED